MKNNKPIVSKSFDALANEPVKSDLERASRFTDAEIEAMAQEDGAEEFDFAKAKFANIEDIAALMKKKQPKQAISIRLDAEVLAWYRSQGRGYQTLIGELLTAYMQSQVASLPKAEKAPGTKAQAVHVPKSRPTKAACSK